MRRQRLTRSQRGIAPDIRAAVHDLMRWVRALPQVQDDIILHLVNAPAIGTPDGQAAFGVFRWPLQPPAARKHVWIFSAAGVVDLMEQVHGEPRADAIDTLRHTILHEFAHYEQWRAGREPTERGVNRRASNLLRRYHEAAA